MIQMNDLVIAFAYNFLNSYNYIKWQFENYSLLPNIVVWRNSLLGGGGSQKEASKNANLINST